MSETDKVRLVRCPKCEKLLPEVTDFSINRCGGCGAIHRRPSSPPQTKTISSAPSASSESSISPYSFGEFSFPFSSEGLLQSSAWQDQDWEWDPPQNSRYISRWRVVKHAVVAALRFHRLGTDRNWNKTVPNLPDLDLKSIIEASGTGNQNSRYISRWRVVKHAIVAALRFHRLGTDRNWNKTVPNLPDLDLKSIIEASGTGKVYRVVNRHTGLTFALKEFRDDSSQRQQISADVQILKELDHPNLVKCYDVVFGDAGVSFLLLEPLDRGFSNVTCEFDLLTFAYQLLLGLNFLHRNRIRHGDIKLSNIFVDHTGQVKLLYLGKTLSNTTPFSPEIGAIHDEFSWDVWSVGLCILKLGKSSGRFSVSEDVQKQPSTELLRFLSACMQADVLKRWTAEQLVHHPFFDQLSHKKELQLNKEIQLPSINEEKDLFNLREELMSPVKKKPRISTEDEDRVYNLETPKDSTTHEVPESCIEHCNLFLPDCEFEKDKLVRMWIAEECFELGATKRMEDLGNLYFDALIEREVIVPSKFDTILRQTMYKFNTSQVPDGLLKQGNYLRITPSNMNEIDSEALHLTWKCKTLDRSFSDALKTFKQLRTLVVHGDRCAVTGQLPNDFFLGLKLLRTLDLSRTHIAEVPGSIGKLESLRYLDMSGTPIQRLPESVDRLHRLQTLNLKYCVGLSALPRGLGKLVELRHLDLDIISQLKSMPRGIRNLVKLQTLQAFIVGRKNDGYGIGELKNMNEISGSFCISMLENVSSAEEAREAALLHKMYIDKLELRWSDCGDANSQDTAEILESLQPHFHLKELLLSFYGGSRFPRWMSNPFYTDLVTMTLYKCINCAILPSIGELPSLKILKIFHMENVRNISTLFCRNIVTTVVNAFPRLEELTLEGMSALEVWTGVEDGDFPCLAQVSIRYCPELRLLPLSQLSSLERLEISHCKQLISLTEGSLPDSLDSLIIRCCPGINERCYRDGVDWPKIAAVRNIWIDFEKLGLD